MARVVIQVAILTFLFAKKSTVSVFVLILFLNLN